MSKQPNFIKVKLPVLQNRCSGHCCYGFSLPFSHDELKKNFGKKAYNKWIKNNPNATKQDLNTVKNNLMISKMVIPLGKVTKRFFEQTRLFLKMDECLTRMKAERPYLYTCKHLDKETGNCKAYKDRPNMCRTFPDNREYCEFKNCTHKKYNLKSLVKNLGNA